MAIILADKATQWQLRRQYPEIFHERFKNLPKGTAVQESGISTVSAFSAVSPSEVQLKSQVPALK